MLQYLEWTVSIEQDQPVNHNATVSNFDCMNRIVYWIFSVPSLSLATTTSLVSTSMRAIQISSISTTVFISLLSTTVNIKGRVMCEYHA